VTAAYHLPRAIGAFRKVGFPVEPYPVDWRTRSLRLFPTLGDGLRLTDTAVREWVGLAVYWLTGHSLQLFPAPDSRSAVRFERPGPLTEHPNPHGLLRSAPRTRCKISP